MEKSSLIALARELVESAGSTSSGRASRTVFGGHNHVLRQTVIALWMGQELSDHQNPGEATLQVLVGHIRLKTAQTQWEGKPGDLIIIPESVHSVEAVESSAILLTVAKALS
jgi:quercetin dioxygenase-like cupin family protein